MITQEIKPFRIESGIPVPKRGQPPSQVIKEALHRLTYALNNMHATQSIVVTNISPTTVRKFLREELPELNTRIQIIDKAKGWFRLWVI
jgi:hypothetical protein